MNFLTIDDLTREQLETVLARATDHKERGRAPDVMDGRTMASGARPRSLWSVARASTISSCSRVRSSMVRKFM